MEGRGQLETSQTPHLHPPNLELDSSRPCSCSPTNPHPKGVERPSCATEIGSGGGGGEGVQNNSGEPGGETGWEPGWPTASPGFLSPFPIPSPPPAASAQHLRPFAIHPRQALSTTPGETGVAAMGPEAPGCTHPEQIQAPLRCSSRVSPEQACRRWDLRPQPPAHQNGPDFLPRVSPQTEHGPNPVGPGLDSTSPDRTSFNRETWSGKYPSVAKNPPAEHRGVPPQPPDR